MSLFFTLGSTVYDWGLPKNGQTWQACQRSKVVQKGPKVTKMVNVSVFDHLIFLFVFLIWFLFCFMLEEFFKDTAQNLLPIKISLCYSTLCPGGFENIFGNGAGHKSLQKFLENQS